MQKLSVKNILRVLAVLIFVVGAFVGYDAGNQMFTVDGVVTYRFVVIDAVVAWFFAFARGMLFWGIAKIIDLLEQK